VARLLGIIRKIHESGTTIILIEHHMDVVRELCDIVTVLDGGKVIAEGKPAEVNRNPAVIAAYLGSSAAEPGSEPVLAGVSRC
jgi:branched-chain amino acid transport system permease protein